MATIDVAALNRLGKVFVSANAAAATVSVVGTAMTGLILNNQQGSGVKVVLIDAGWVWTTVPAAAQRVGIGVTTVQGGAIPVTLTAVTAVSADGRGNTPVSAVWSVATFAVAPVARRWFLNAPWNQADATLTNVAANLGQDRIDGSIILAPGASAMLIALTTAAVGMGSFTWAEVPA
jgi:hypothetical protein